MIDFASSFGTLVLTRAYADWSAPMNADYRGQLVSRAVDLVQLFPAAAYAKNGADIRLAVDAVEDMFLGCLILPMWSSWPGIPTCIALAQRCRRLGAATSWGWGSPETPTSRALAAACDELVTYDGLPGIESADAPQLPRRPADRGACAARRALRHHLAGPCGSRRGQAAGGRGHRRDGS